MSATADFDSPLRHGDTINRGLAASTKVFGGTIAAINAAGNCLPAADTAGLKVMGFFKEGVDNRDGDAGDLSVDIDRRPRRVLNSTGNAVTAADIGRIVYVEDDQTACKVGGTNHIPLGICIDLDADGVWVDPKLAPLAV